MGEAVYAIDDFPDDDLLWRIEWIGGVGYNTSVPSETMASKPVLSTTTKRRFHQRIVLPGVKATETDITVLGMRGLKNQTIPARLQPILQ